MRIKTHHLIIYSSTMYHFVIVLLGLLMGLFLIILSRRTIDGFEDKKDGYKAESGYQTQVALLTNQYQAIADKRRPVTTLLETNVMPSTQQNFVNFFAHGCRYAAYLGPTHNGYFDPDIGIQMAVAAGCRVFVLDIDYLDDCGDYFPRLVVRDVQGKLQIGDSSNLPVCNSAEHSNLRKVCEKINFFAFSSSSQNATDPLVIVLYFQRIPPGSYKSKLVLDYYSKVAQCLHTFDDHLLQNELEGGSYYRQKQEGLLLINKIQTYTNKVLIFSNANTSGFREIKDYPTNKDLDFYVNLRLGYSQTKFGITDTGAPFGILQAVEDYLVIPSDRVESTVESTKMHWTICLPKDPLTTVTADDYKKITQTYGVNCVPMNAFQTDQTTYLYDASLFKTYSYLPKPEPIRYIAPPVITPAEPSKTTDAKGGFLREPTTS